MVIAKPINKIFRKAASRWSILSIMLFALMAIPVVIYTSRISSERQAEMLARSAALAFRPMILSGNSREAQFQIEKAFELEAGEEVAIFDEVKKPIFQQPGRATRFLCDRPKAICWNSVLSTLSIVWPIYIDAEESQIFGYVQFKLKPRTDTSLIMSILALLSLSFLFQIAGIRSTLKQMGAQLSDQLSAWATHLSTHPETVGPATTQVPFKELASMVSAVAGLHSRISQLTEKVAAQAKIEGQSKMLREIGHDLKTPNSQASKFFEIHLDTVNKMGRADIQEVQRVRRALQKMHQLVSQVRFFDYQSKEINPSCDVAQEANTAVSDLQGLSEIAEKYIALSFFAEDPDIKAKITPIAFTRILENLVINSIHAVNPKGRVEVFITQVNENPTLIVQDNGPGIPEKLRSRVFDFDFTTKASRGTGLGLGIVKRLCDEFNATLHLGENPTGGARFVISFQQVFRGSEYAVPNLNR